MKILRASALLAVLLSGPAFLLSGPAFAQDESPHINLLADGPAKTPEEIEKAREVEKAYKDTLKKIPNAAVNTDPWGNVRTESQPKSKARAAASPTKNASAKPKA
ncbi:MAG: hypothetical protein JSS22_12700, partial [Proteobacteria bacterium]|nr:hypothetical protein [Pseudomonadota bacterium]